MFLGLKARTPQVDLLVMRLVILVGAGALLVASSLGGGTVHTPAEGGSRAVNRQVALTAHGSDGDPLSWRGFLDVMTNGHPGQRNDVLLDPGTLRVVKIAPLQPGGRGQTARFRWPERPVALALAWPSPAGYSNLIIDIPGPGQYDVEDLAVQAYAPHAAATSLASSGRGTAARPATGKMKRASADAQALAYRDALVSDGLASLPESVPADLLSGVTGGRGPSTAPPVEDVPTWTFTLDDAADSPEQALRAAAGLVRRSAGEGWVRLVFDADMRPEDYRPAVNAAHQLGLQVLGQPADSTMVRGLSPAAYARRFATWVDAFPEIEAWEVGNEINGPWLGRNVVEKVRRAAAVVKARSSARTMITLYWQLGEDDARHSVFTWAHNELTPDVLRLIDEIGLSMYPGDNPMGLAFERVMWTLHDLFPDKVLMIGELGYHTPDGSNLWWWGSQDDPAAGRAAVAAFYQNASRGVPWLKGGTYWWYFQEDVADPSFLAGLATLGSR